VVRFRRKDREALVGHAGFVLYRHLFLRPQFQDFPRKQAVHGVKGLDSRHYAAAHESAPGDRIAYGDVLQLLAGLFGDPLPQVLVRDEDDLLRLQLLGHLRVSINDVVALAGVSFQVV
jgi:hypothetical protein